MRSQIGCPWESLEDFPLILKCMGFFVSLYHGPVWWSPGEAVRSNATPGVTVTDTMWVLAVIAGAVGECPVH